MVPVCNINVICQSHACDELHHLRLFLQMKGSCYSFAACATKIQPFVAPEPCAEELNVQPYKTQSQLHEEDARPAQTPSHQTPGAPPYRPASVMELTKHVAAWEQLGPLSGGKPSDRRGGCSQLHGEAHGMGCERPHMGYISRIHLLLCTNT